MNYLEYFQQIKLVFCLQRIKNSHWVNLNVSNHVVCLTPTTNCFLNCVKACISSAKHLGCSLLEVLREIEKCIIKYNVLGEKCFENHAVFFFFFKVLFLILWMKPNILKFMPCSSKSDLILIQDSLYHISSDLLRKNEL